MNAPVYTKSRELKKKQITMVMNREMKMKCAQQRIANYHEQ